MKITVSGTVFTSYDVKTKNSSKNEMSFEETLQSQNQQSYQTNHQLSQTSSKTIFIDPVNGGNISVSLENSTLEKLQNRFGVNSVVKNEAGDVELNDKAQDFVAGWFADIAYAREFLKADINNDGVLSEEEYGNTRNDTNISLKVRFDEDTFLAEEKAIENYSKRTDWEYVSYRNGKNEGSIDEELNYTLNLDKNFDGNITLQEAYDGESSVNDKVKYDLQKLYIDSDFFKNDGHFSSYFNQALNYILEIMDKGEDLDKEKWEQIRKDNYLKLDGEYLKLDMELISTLEPHLIEELLKKLEQSSSTFQKNSFQISNETTQEFLNRTNIVNKETEIYG